MHAMLSWTYRAFLLSFIYLGLYLLLVYSHDQVCILVNFILLLFLLKLQGLISGSAETREQAALGLGELIDVTSEKTLREFVVSITGYFILCLCFHTSIVVLKTWLTFSELNQVFWID
jgi:hypothetical protein